MKKAIAILLTLALLGLPACGTYGDPLVEDFYTRNVYPAVTSTYDVGSPEREYAEGYFGSLYAENITLSGSGPVILEGEGLVWIEFRPDLDFESVRAHGVPSWVVRGVFGGFSLPIYAADWEELQIEICVPDRWYRPAWTYLQDVGDMPGGMAVYEGNLYIPCENDDNVWVYDGTDFAISGNVGNAPRYSCVYNGNLYVTCRLDDSVWVFNGTNWALSGNVGDKPEGMAVFEGDLYVACEGDDEIWRLSGGVWAVDPALGLGGVAGAVGTTPKFLATFDGDLYVGCTQVDDDVWIRAGGAWAKDDDVGGDPQEFHIHNAELYVNCLSDDTIWVKGAMGWAIFTNVGATIGNAPIGLEEYEGDLFSACAESVWSDIEDFWNQNSDFNEVTADEPMFFMVYDGRLYCSSQVGDGIWVYEGETAWVHIHCWLTNAQAGPTEAFRLYVEYANFTAGVDVVPLAGEDVIVETLTGVAVAFQSYKVDFPLDMTGVDWDDNIGIRLQRIASSDEIAGEVVIKHIGVMFKCDKLGNPTHN